MHGIEEGDEILAGGDDGGSVARDCGGSVVGGEGGGGGGVGAVGELAVWGRGDDAVGWGCFDGGREADAEAFGCLGDFELYITITSALSLDLPTSCDPGDLLFDTTYIPLRLESLQVTKRCQDGFVGEMALVLAQQAIARLRVFALLDGVAQVRFLECVEGDDDAVDFR